MSGPAVLNRTTSSATASSPSRWLPPPDGYVKLCTDGALDTTAGRGGTGFILRDNAGTFIAAGAIKFQGLTDPLLMEALAIREGVTQALRRDIRRVQITSDCKWLTDEINNEGNSRSLAAPIIFDIKTSLTFFEESLVLFEGRQTNNDAHACAKHACKMQGPQLRPARYGTRNGFDASCSIRCFKGPSTSRQERFLSETRSSIRYPIPELPFSNMQANSK